MVIPEPNGYRPGAPPQACANGTQLLCTVLTLMRLISICGNFEGFRVSSERPQRDKTVPFKPH